MGRGFGKKYKKIIKSVYPLTPDGDVQVHNIGKLVHFCQISPTKLIKVASYVEKKTNSDLTKSKLRSVGASMKIFQDLIKGCRKNLNLFSNNALRLIKLLLECSFPKLKIIAAETFIQFTEVLDENTPYPELEGLITYLIDMCQNQIRDSEVQTRLKQDGLKSIRAYIRVLEMTDELDGFIARHADEDNWAVLLPAILDNLSFPGVTAENDGANKPFTQISPPAPVLRPPSSHSEHDGDESHRSSTHSTHSNAEADPQLMAHLVADSSGESVHELATEVLRDIFSRANISVTSMFKAILRYLEFRHRWVPNTFAVYVIDSIYSCLKVQHGQILITLLLQHAELPQHPITVKTQIFMTTIQFFTEATGYFMQILDSLMKNLVSSVEFASQDQQVADNDNAHLAFQNNMIACLGVLCGKISQQQKLDAFSALCTRLSSSKHVSSSGLSGVVVVFARAILQTIVNMSKFPIELLVPYLRLFQELSTHNNNDVRIFVQKIFQSIIMPGIEAPQTVPQTDEIPHEQVSAVIRGTLYFQIKMRIKHVENYIAIFDTLRAMLFKGRKYDVIESFPLVFAIQKFATKWKKLPPIRAYTIHTLVAAYLYCVAYVFNCSALEAHINTIIQEREKKGHVCSLVILQKSPIPSLVLSGTSEYSIAPQKKVAVEYVLFDRQVVVDLLCSEANSTISGEKKFQKLLMKKFRNQTDTMTLLKPESMAPLLTESMHLSPPITSVATIIEQDNDPRNSLVTSKLVVFSPENSGSAEEIEKSHRSKIDIMSMKRALVSGVYSTPRKHQGSFNDIIDNCLQKASTNKFIATLSDQVNDDRKATWCVFDLDLGALSNS